MIEKILDIFKPLEIKANKMYEKNYLFYAIAVGVILFIGLIGYLIYVNFFS